MEICWILVTIFSICLPTQCLAASLERVADENEPSKEQFGSDDVGFAPSGTPTNFQSWSDWLNKRSFGEYPFGDQNLQAWKEWMDKRGMLQGGEPQFGSSNNFQQWQDWMNKRSGMSTHNSGPMFQTWNEWMKKRGLRGLGNAGVGFGQPSGGSFQSWGDYSKRSGLKDGDLSHIFKRSFGLIRPNNPFSVRFGSNHNMMKWDDMMKRSTDKRQLGNSPAAFGRNNQYFTNGLQDWRYTFQSSKRAAGKAKISKQESN